MIPFMKPRTMGSALIITLMLLVLLTTIILASLVKAQSSRQSSSSIMGNFSANQFAQDGVNQGIALLQYATGQTDARWISQPGRIEKLIASGTSVTSELIDLHSGLAATPADGVNLNAAMLQNPSEGVIAYDPSIKMPLSWIYIRENGVRTANATYDAANKVVGRYAFWTDDNTARVNVNTAWSADPAINIVNSQAHPSRIPLTGAFPTMTPDDVKSIRDFRAGGNFFNTPQDISKAFGNNFASYSTLARESKFWTTNVNASPDAQLTSFGLPKIVLTTKPARAKAKDGTQLPYINVSTSAAIDTTKATLRNYLSRADWGEGLEGSLQAKYYSNNSGLLDQLALNIMEYVRCRESADDVIKPMRHGVGSSGKIFAGATRRFRMVEIGFWRSSTNPSNGRIYFVLTLPRNAGLQSYTMSSWRGMVVTAGNVAEQDIWLPNTTLDAGRYVLLSRPLITPIPNTGAVYARHFRLYRNGLADMFDVYPSGQGAYVELYDFPVTVSAPSSGDPSMPADETLIQTIKVTDPFLGGTKDDWSAPGPNRFADLTDAAKMRAHIGLGVPPSNYQLGQDLDVNGNITDEGTVLPAPAGSPGNLTGYVESLAELGRVHTGISTVPGTPSVPWRTLRLQPRHPQASAHLASVPDWIILDAFALPNIPANETNALLERMNGKGGLVNLNSALKPFSTVERPQALKSLLGVSTQFTEAQKTTAASSIIQQTLANTTIAKGKMAGSGLIQYPGNIVEFAGISDEGEASEARLSGILDLATTRGSIFTIYSVGQRVIQTSTGKLIPKGEASQLSMVERYEDAGAVKFRVILNKPLRY